MTQIGNLRNSPGVNMGGVKGAKELTGKGKNEKPDTLVERIIYIKDENGWISNTGVDNGDGMKDGYVLMTKEDFENHNWDKYFEQGFQPGSSPISSEDQK